MASSATPDAVLVTPGPGALDAATGTQRWTAAVDVGDAGLSPSVDGVVVAGGQDDPMLIALDAATGEMRWEAPAQLAYDDSWAIGDGAVFGVDFGNLVGYELAAGTERWRQPVDPAQYLWPRALTGETLLSMWWNLEARSTVDGSLRWSTDYPAGRMPIDDTPRMSSIVTTPTSAIVTFRISASGGD